MENKTSKYLKYAIGEIILVVIGILIALQINNWNETNKLRNLELDILKEVNTSLESDLEDVIENSNILKNKFKSENIVIDWLKSELPFNDSLSKHLNRIQFGIEFNYQVAPYETLKQLGMRTIENDSLRKQISYLYDFRFENFSTMIRYQNEFIRDLQKLGADQFNEIGFITENIMKPVNLVELRKDNEYQYHMTTIKNYNEYILDSLLPQVENDILKTRKMIEKEIRIRE
jgi:hypothetical protein